MQQRKGVNLAMFQKHKVSNKNKLQKTGLHMIQLTKSSKVQNTK